MWVISLGRLCGTPRSQCYHLIILSSGPWVIFGIHINSCIQFVERDRKDQTFEMILTIYLRFKL